MEPPLDPPLMVSHIRDGGILRSIIHVALKGEEVCFYTMTSKLYMWTDSLKSVINKQCVLRYYKTIMYSLMVLLISSRGGCAATCNSRP